MMRSLQPKRTKKKQSLQIDSLIVRLSILKNNILIVKADLVAPKRILNIVSQTVKPDPEYPRCL